jgi:ketosteroid isomerase-like protein
VELVWPVASLPRGGPHRRNVVDHRCEQHPVGRSGDLAYTVGYEHTVLSIDGGPVAPLTRRVTHLYRREDGEWKIVHRHADRPPTDQSR